MTAVKEPKTTVADPERARPASAPARPKPPPPRDRKRTPDPARREVVRAVSGTITLLGLVLGGFLVYLFALSGISESRAQHVMYDNFTRTLNQAVAPVGPSSPGTPVAVMDVPSLGISHLVVVEGTDSKNLTSGPGHSRNSPLPGQGGVSVVFGRRATFGAPFGDLPDLKVGDPITVTTGQGVSRYVVAAFGGGTHPPQDTKPNRLVLVTADSATVPSTTFSVSADLVSKVQPSAGAFAAVSDAEKAMRNDPDQALVPLVLWGQALILVCVLATVAVRQWAKWPAYICTAPIALAVLWNVYENTAMLLPNLY